MNVISQYSNYFFAAAAVLAVLVLLLSLTRRNKKKLRDREGQRLGIVEYLEIDQARRLLLIRRDNAEHLILIGGPADLVIETGTVPLSAPEIRGHDAEVAARPAVTPPVFADRRPVPIQAPARTDPPLAAYRNRDQK